MRSRDSKGRFVKAAVPAPQTTCVWHKTWFPADERCPTCIIAAQERAELLSRLSWHARLRRWVRESMGR